MSNGNLLIVDDNREFAENLAKVLMEEGYQATISTNPIEALEALRHGNSYDLILLDINMEELNGVDFCHELRTFRSYLELPLIFVTGEVGVDNIVSGFYAGGNDYIAKPIDVDLLLNRIFYHLNLVRKIKIDVEFEKTLTIYRLILKYAFEVMKPLETAILETRKIKKEQKNSKLIEHIELSHKRISSFIDKMNRMLLDGDYGFVEEQGFVEHTIEKRSARREKILLVDDDPIISKVIKEFLENENYRVFCVENTKKAYELLNYQDIDLIILDIYMPNETGINFCKRFKEESDFVNIPVLFVSTDNRREVILSALKFGGADFISKPFAKEELIVRVKNQLNILKTYHNDLYIKQVNTIVKIADLYSHEILNPLNIAKSLVCLEKDKNKKLFEAIEEAYETIEALTREISLLRSRYQQSAA